MCERHEPCGSPFTLLADPVIADPVMALVFLVAVTLCMGILIPLPGYLGLLQLDGASLCEHRVASQACALPPRVLVAAERD